MILETAKQVAAFLHGQHNTPYCVYMYDNKWYSVAVVVAQEEGICYTWDTTKIWQ